MGSIPVRVTKKEIPHQKVWDFFFIYPRETKIKYHSPVDCGSPQVSMAATHLFLPKGKNANDSLRRTERNALVIHSSLCYTYSN